LYKNYNYNHNKQHACNTEAMAVAKNAAEENKRTDVVTKK